MKQRLLIVEDDCLMAEAAADYFMSKGWEVQREENGIQALETLETKSFHLILLDVMMPKMDGFALCREIRKNSDVPVIFITARMLEEDKLNGYSLGADDYITKPFSLPVLYAKAMALTGRIQGKSSLLEVGNLTIDRKSHKVWSSGQPISLAPKEYEILLFLMENPERIYSRQQLLIRFWGYDFDGNERVVDNQKVEKSYRLLWMYHSDCAQIWISAGGGKMKRKNKRFWKPVVIGFGVVYVLTMGFTTFLVKEKFKEGYTQQFRQAAVSMLKRVSERESAMEEEDWNRMT